MSPRSKKESVEAIYLRYPNASRSEKVPILDEFCATLGYPRKHAIRVPRKVKQFRKTKTQRPGRAPFYPQPHILKPLKKIWLVAILPCSKRPKIILPLWIPGYIQSFGPLPPKVVEAYPTSPLPPSTASSALPASTTKNGAAPRDRTISTQIPLTPLSLSQYTHST
jgi:hypothetical protein